MKIKMTWGWRISLQIVLIAAPLLALLVFKLDAESRNAQALAAAFPRQLIAGDAHLAYQGFVDGFNDAVYSGTLSDNARKGLAGSQKALRELAALGVPEAGEHAARVERLTAKLSGRTSVEPLLDDKAEIQALQQAIQAQRLRFQEATAETIARAHAQIARQALAVSISAVFVLAIAVLMVRSLVRGLTRPLQRGTALADRIASGNLVLPEQAAGGSDETAQLLTALQAMAAKLEALVRHVKQSAGAVDMATSEVAQGNLDLSARTERAAQSIQAMAHSAARLGDSARSSSANAQRAAELSAEARKAAAEGRRTVQVVRGTVQELAQSSKQMLEITSVIDGIAAQTNILAFNAAATATRSGDQGRVFTAVATEIRNLSARCAEAAKQISQLLKASVARIEAGAVQIEKAASAMEGIEARTGEVDGVVGAISRDAATQHQAIEQMLAALNGLDGMTQQNAALVEQISATSEALKGQTADLSEAVASFIVADDGGADAPSPTAAGTPAQAWA